MVLRNPLQLLFAVPAGDRKFYNVILWWELRRIAYNAILAIAGIASLALFALFVDGWFDFISPPLFPALFFVFFANFFYTGGWIVELILRALDKDRVGRFGPRALKYGTLFSMFIAFVPTLMAGVMALTGHKMVSPYSQFTTKKPELANIEGIYYLKDAISLEQVKRPNEVVKSPRLELERNGRLRFIDVPFVVDGDRPSLFLSRELHLPQDSREMDNALLLTGTAEWKLSQGNFRDDVWNVQVHLIDFDTLEEERTWSSADETFTIYLQGNAPPYRLYYLMGDPDSMIGMEFVRDVK